MNGAVCEQTMTGADGSGRGPVTITTAQTRVTSGIEVHQKLMTAALALGNILRSTFGPRGLDKMMYKSNGTTAVTNDGARIIADLLVKHPAAKAFVSLGESQESSCGDGVTGCILLASELMRESGRLLQRGLHPLIIIEGWRQALDVALEVIDEHSLPMDDESMLMVAETALVGKVAETSSDHLAGLVVDAINTIHPEPDSNVGAEDVMMVKAGKGTISDSRMVKGVILMKRTANEKVPRSVHSVRIALLTCPLEFEKTKRDSEIEISDPEQMRAFIEAGRRQLETMTKGILATGCNAVLTTGQVDPQILHSLTDKGVFVLGGVDESDMENTSRATGGNLVDLVRNIGESDLGQAEHLQVENQEGADGTEERVIIDGCGDPGLVTLEIGGANDIGCEEVIRSLHDSLRATTLARKEGEIIPGGGHIHCKSALRIRTIAEGLPGRERLAMESFARALESIPFTLATNAGKEGLDSILDLRAALRNEPEANMGIRLDGEVGDVSEVMLPSASLANAFIGAFETAGSLLRVDQVISARGD